MDLLPRLSRLLMVDGGVSVRAMLFGARAIRARFVSMVDAMSRFSRGVIDETGHGADIGRFRVVGGACNRLGRAGCVSASAGVLSVRVSSVPHRRMFEAWRVRVMIPGGAPITNVEWVSEFGVMPWVIVGVCLLGVIVSGRR